MRSSEKLRFCYCEPFYIPVIASPSLPVIASPSLLVIARSEATKQSPKNSNSSLQFCVYSKKKIQLYKTKIVVNCLSMVPFFVH